MSSYRTLMDNGQAPSGDSIQNRVPGMTHWALDHPTDHLALVPLLVRDLGMKHAPALDLAQPQSGTDPILDQVQVTLLQIYLLYPTTHTGSQKKTAFRSLAVSHAGGCSILKYSLSTFNPNSYLSSDSET